MNSLPKTPSLNFNFSAPSSSDHIVKPDPSNGIPPLLDRIKAAYMRHLDNDVEEKRLLEMETSAYRLAVKYAEFLILKRKKKRNDEMEVAN